MYKVLVAEDESIERKVLCKLLDKYLSGVCTVVSAKNGTEAWNVFEAEQPHIAILDIHMPGLTGLEVARKIRAAGSACAIIFLSAYDNFAYAKEAISIRATDYLLKPYGERELIATVEEAMRIYEYYGAIFHKAEELPAPDAASPENSVGLRNSQIKEEIEQHIHAHFGEDLSMQDVARTMNYSDAYFCKLFKRCFKVNFSTYLNEYRIERAKELLTSTHSSVREISTACGYTDSTYFARVFRRVTGVTPSEYRAAAQPE